MKPHARILTDEDKAGLKALYEGPEDWPVIHAWLASRGYDHTRGTIQKTASLNDWAWGCQVPRGSAKRYRRPHLNQDALLLLDAHVPYHDSDWINRCVELALAWGIKLCLMDTDALDLTWLSSFERPLDATREREARAWRDVADVLCDAFPAVHLHAGNHGARIRRIVQRMSQDGRDLLNAVTDDPVSSVFLKRKEMVLSDSSACVVHNSWLVGHPSAASLHTASYLAETHRLNVAVGHTHYRSMLWSRDDALQAVEVGMCADPGKLQYIAERLPARARGLQRQGAAIIKKTEDGVFFHLLTPRHSDLRALKKLYR